MTMTDAEREQFLAGLGLSPDAATLTADVQSEAKAKKPKKAKGVTLVANPHTIPVSDIVFDAALVEDFALDSSDMAQASRLLFDLYKSPTKGERNKFLHRKITEFLMQTKRERQPAARDGFIKGKVKATKDDRDLAQMIAQAGITPDELALALAALKAAKQS